jgi:hypothetical protein
MPAVEKRTSAALSRSSGITAVYEKYAAFLIILRAVNLRIFEQPATVMRNTDRLLRQPILTILGLTRAPLSAYYSTIA